MKPWRKVVYIGHRTGLRGGYYWQLLLDCGHSAGRPMPRVGLPAALGRRAKYVTAPRKIRCTLCGLGAEPHPETIPGSMDLMDKIESKLRADSTNPERWGLNKGDCCSS